MESVVARREQQRTAVRRAVLDAAARLLAEEGAEALSMRRLAEQSGYTVPTLYHRFGHKLGLIEAVLDEAFAPLVRDLERVPRGRDPVRHVARLVRVFVEFGLRKPVEYQLLMVPVSGGMPTPASVERAREFLDEALQELAREGRLRGTKPEHAAQVIWVVTHGLISLPTQRPEIDWSDDLCRQAVEGVLHGLVASRGGGE